MTTRNTTIFVQQTTAVLLPQQSWWNQLPKRYCHYSCHGATYPSTVATTVITKPTIKALLPLQSWWSQPTKRFVHCSSLEANYQSAVATAGVLKPTTKALWPLQSSWRQLPKRCGHYSRHDTNYQSDVATSHYEANYQSAVATTIVMKTTTNALWPLQLSWSQIPKRCCHYSGDEANYENAVATTVVMKPTTKTLSPNYRDTTAHRCYREHCKNSITTSFIRLRSLHFLLLAHSTVLAVSCGKSHCVTAWRYNL